jgi:hypothetical protein
MASSLKGRGVKTWILENFGAGLDLRETYYSLDQNRFAVLQNVYITKGRKLKRRPPCILSTGAFDTQSGGLLNINGQLTTFAQQGATPSLPPGVAVAYFDQPPGSTAWRIADYTTLNNVACLLLLHTFSNGLQQYVLHVLDGAPDVPTYVTDPAFPWAHTFGASTPVDPSLTVAASKLWCSGPDFNAYQSGTANPRVWQTKQQLDFVTGGIEFHVYCAQAGLQSFTVPINFAFLQTWSGYLSYAVQQYIGPTTSPNWLSSTNWGNTGGNAGTRYAEQLANPVLGACAVAGIANGADATTYTQWTQVTVNTPNPGMWVRFVVQVPNDWPQPLVNYVVSGGITPQAFNNSVGYGAVPTQLTSFLGDGGTTVFTLPANFIPRPSGVTANYDVYLNGSHLIEGTDFTVGTVAVGGGTIAATIIFASAPALSLPIDVYQCFAWEGWLMVPPGSVATATGTYPFPGGWLQMPITGVDTHYVIALTLNGSAQPNIINGTVLANGLTALSPLTGSVLSGEARADFVPMIYLEVSTAGHILNAAFPWISNYRNQTWDQTQFLLAGAIAGFENAGFIATSQYETSGGPITALVQYSNRLLVLYKNASLLYYVDANPTNDRLLDTSAIGTGTQTQSYGAELYSMVIVPSVNGFRALDLTRYAPDDNLQDLDIGDPIDALGEVPVLGNAYWPFQGEYIAAATLSAGQADAALELSPGLVWFCFDYSKESKIASWSTWTTAGISSVDYRAIVPIDNRLYFRSGTKLYYFDASPCNLPWPALASNGVNGLFQDTNDAGNPYLSQGFWHYNNMKMPERTKRFVGMDVLQDGTASWTFRNMPSLPTFEDGGFTWTGPSVGSPSIPLCMSCRALAPVFRSTDARGYNLEGIIINFVALGQGTL